MSSNLQRVHILPWRDMPRWDLKSTRAAAFRAAHPDFRPLGQFIEESTEIVHPSREPAHTWPVYGVNNKDGVRFSHLQLGKAFNSAYKRIRKDWFFHNPTRANVGSLGRVSDVPADAITSPEYQVWRIRQDLLPDFVEILIRLPFFLDLVECHRVGAVKERLFIDNLCEIPIPVLAEHDQRVIVNRWRTAQNQIAAAYKRVENQAVDIKARFLDGLGLKVPNLERQPRAFAVWWKDLFGLSARATFLCANNSSLNLGRYPVTRGRDCFVEVRHGCSASPSPVPTSTYLHK